MRTTEFYAPVIHHGFLYFDMGLPKRDDTLPRRSSMYGSEDELRQDVIRRLDNKAEKVRERIQNTGMGGISMYQSQLDHINDVKANFSVAKVTVEVL
jgi:hypothetical protein